MKKVLSVLLAAAMVMGMSVASFADVTFGSKSSKDLKAADLTKISVDDVIAGFDKANSFVVRNGKAVALTDETTLMPGDDIYFPMLAYSYSWSDVTGGHTGLPSVAPKYAGDSIKTKVDGTVSTVSTENTITWKASVETATPIYTGDIDMHWSINVKGSDVIESGVFYNATGKETFKALNKGEKFVKLSMIDEFDSTSITTKVNMELYVADQEFNNVSTESVIFYDMAFKNESVTLNEVSYDSTNDADRYAQWNATAAGKAVFDFDDDVYFTVKMVSGEKVVLNMSRAYNKDIDAAYNDNDGELEFYNFKGSKDAFYRVGELFIPADEATYIYGVELDKDGEVEDIWAIEDAEWTDEYTIAGLAKEYEGWVIKTDELGFYIVSDEELVLPVEEVEVEEPAVEAEPEKANPETGAADFVGAAVAMAVVSVAAAGALALKK